MTNNEYFNVGQPIYTNGDYRIFEQTKECYLHTFKNIAITQLVKPNKELINNLADGIEPKGDYTPYHFLYNRTLDNKKKGLEMYNFNN